MNVLAVGVGIFYFFAGIIALRAMRLDAAMDLILVALEGKPIEPNEKYKAYILTWGSLLTMASGLALATLSALAQPLFIANTLVQGGYLFWASTALPPTDATEAKGRAQTTNAFVIYAAMTACVIWLDQVNGLRPWSNAIADIAIIIVGTLAGWGLLFLPTAWLTSRQSTDTDTPSELGQSDAPIKPINLRLSPSWQTWPLCDDDTGEPVSHHSLDLPDDLVERIEAWDDSWQETYNGDDPLSSGFKDESALQAYRATGKQLAEEVAKSWPGQIKVSDEFR